MFIPLCQKNDTVLLFPLRAVRSRRSVLCSTTELMQLRVDRNNGVGPELGKRAEVNDDTHGSESSKECQRKVMAIY